MDLALLTKSSPSQAIKARTASIPPPIKGSLPIIRGGPNRHLQSKYTPLWTQRHQPFRDWGLLLSWRVAWCHHILIGWCQMRWLTVISELHVLEMWWTLLSNSLVPSKSNTLYFSNTSQKSCAILHGFHRLPIAGCVFSSPRLWQIYLNQSVQFLSPISQNSISHHSRRIGIFERGDEIENKKLGKNLFPAITHWAFPPGYIFSVLPRPAILLW